MAIPLLKHDFISKAKQAQPGTAVAHLRYITRLEATAYVGSNLSTNHHQLVRELTAREERTRANGRIIDKFIIALPREMTMEQATSAVHKFGNALTKGRAWYVFSIQDWSAANPHCHFILVDEDRETRRRVAKTSELGSSHRIKRLWQEIGNAELDALGIDARIDFDAAEQKAEEKRLDLVPDNDNQPIPETIEPEPEAEDADVLEPEDTLDEGEDDMPYVSVQHEDDEDYERWSDMPPEYRQRAVGDLLNMQREVAYFTHLQSQRKEAVEAYHLARDRAMRAAIEAGNQGLETQRIEQKVHMTKQAHDALHHANGKAKGMTLRVFGRTLWQSPTARQADEAKLAYSSALNAYDWSKRDLEMLQTTSERLSQEAGDLMHRAEELQRQLVTIGTDEELDDARAAHEEGIRRLASNLTSLEIMRMYEDGEIDQEEAADLLVLLGRSHEVADLNEHIEAGDEEEQGPDQ